MFRKNKKDRVLENEAGKSECKQDLRALRKLGVMEDADVQAMLRGTSMVKVRSASWQKSRLLRLLEDGMTVWLESKKRLRRAAAQQTFSVLEVDCVREGCQSEALRGLEGSAPEQQCFTVVFRGGKRKSLDLRGGSSEEVQCWVRGLRKLQERALSMSQRDKLEHWIYGYLRRADLNKDGKMSYEEVRSLLKMINIELNEQYARCLFKQCDRSANGRLENSEIAEYCRRLMRRPELEAVFWRYSGNDSALSAEELREFLQDQGEEQATLAHAHTIIQTYELSDRAKKSQFMTMDGFTMYLLSSESNVFNPAHAPVSQDMTQPLAHYFISASHNTYLTKDQITSMSSTEPYIRALNQGCRCVELDCWDGDKGEPVICHGHTLTSKIPFREVIQTIAQYAFKASPYPLILSLENHCTVEQQAVMAKHLRTLLGDSLVTKPINGQLSSSLPSPEELKGRILVKGKKETGQQVKTDSAGSSSGSEDEMVGGPRSNKNKEVAKAPSVANGNKQAGTSKLSPELSDLVVYCRSTPFRGFEQAAQLPNEMSSFSESEAQRHIKESGTAFVQHNTRQLSRIYPSGQRIQSSNYNPQDMWNCGCQIVALNFQTPGEQMDLNQGRFLANGRCGYILKPAFLCAENSTFDPENPLQGQGYQPTQLTIKVISAQQLPKLNTDKPNSIVDPLVRIEVHGVSSDNAKEETPYITNNGFNPLWNCTLSFKIQVPELALIRFVVEDHDLASSNDFVGQFTLPFTSLRRGFRHVHLLKEDGCSLSPATLFIHVKVSALGSTKPVSP